MGRSFYTRPVKKMMRLVPGKGLEPPWPEGRRILSPLRLPVPPSRPRFKLTQTAAYLKNRVSPIMRKSHTKQSKTKSRVDGLILLVGALEVLDFVVLKVPDPAGDLVNHIMVVSY